MVLQSFIAGKFVLNFNDSFKVLLLNSQTTTQTAFDFLITHPDIIGSSLKILNNEELVMLMNYAIYGISKKCALNCIDPVQINDRGEYILNESIANKNKEKLRNKHKIIDKIYLAEDTIKNSSTSIYFTDDYYGSSIYSALLRYSLVNV